MTWQTHQIQNQFDEYQGHNLYTSDAALQEAVRRLGGTEMSLIEQGAELGSTKSYQLAEDANRHLPELKTFDSRGRRIDVVEFHPAWHHWLALSRAHGLHASPFAESHDGRWAEWAARFYMHAQIESGSECPTSMTLGAIPLLQREPALWQQIGAKLLTRSYDPQDVPIPAKQALWIGMGMTEKQGGSDVRSNQTTATPLGAGGRGGEYVLRGHKWFFSAPMCDAHLVVARTPEDGLACFYVPRWRPDGSKNPVQIQRLKNKVGNKSNSSSEVEFQDAWGVLMGEPGRGIPTIIEMATYTRLTCSLSSAGFMRQALVQAIAYARRRHAFGRTLAEQPLMRAVLADLSLESEAAVALSMRLVQAYARPNNEVEQAWQRIMTPVAKFWVCKRAIEFTGETMEVFGGNGYVDDGIMARLYREAPVNSIWEGSGNVMCLDVMRAIARMPQLAVVLLDDLAQLAGDDDALRAETQSLLDLMQADPAQLEGMGRAFTARLAILAQGCLLRRHAPSAVADAFVGTRLGQHWGGVVGLLTPHQWDTQAILARALAA